MPKQTFWFKHDYEPTSDFKMSSMLSDFGAIGYGLYWRTVELLYQGESHKLSLQKFTYKAISKQIQANAKQNEANAEQSILPSIQISPEQVEHFLKQCIDEHKLFCSDGEFLWSERVNRDMDIRTETSIKRSQSGSKGGQANAKQKLANAKQTKAIGKQSQAEKRREEKSIEEIEDKSSKEKNCCCYTDESEMRKDAAAAISRFKKDLPDKQVQSLTDDIVSKFLGKQISDLQALCNSFVKNMRTKDASRTNGSAIEVAGIEHEAKKHGKDWAYPTIVGEQFSDDFQSVRLIDGSYRKLSQLESNAARKGNLKPSDVFRVDKSIIETNKILNYDNCGKNGHS